MITTHAPSDHDVPSGHDVPNDHDDERVPSNVVHRGPTDVLPRRCCKASVPEDATNAFLACARWHVGRFHRCCHDCGDFAQDAPLDEHRRQ